MKIKRNPNFELLRLLSMFFIIKFCYKKVADGRFSVVSMAFLSIGLMIAVLAFVLLFSAYVIDPILTYGTLNPWE